MSKKWVFLLSVVVTVSCFQAQSADFVEFKKNRGHEGRDRRGDNNSDTIQNPNPGSGEDADIVKAAEKRRRVDFVEGRGMVVTKLLPDDRNGLEHQKWMVRLSNGMQMQAVYNLDMCEYVDLKVGDVVAMGGQFVWTNQGAMLHWLHYDPRERRPDGYVEVNGKVYCGDGERHH